MTCRLGVDGLAHYRTLRQLRGLNQAAIPRLTRGTTCQSVRGAHRNLAETERGLARRSAGPARCGPVVGKNAIVPPRGEGERILID